MSRTKRTSWKLDEEKTLALHQRGFTNHEIARQLGVAPSTVSRFLQRHQPEQQAVQTFVEAFKAGRADRLAHLQAKALAVKEKVIDSLTDAIIDALLPHQKSHLLVSLNNVMGTAYDKERLERGQSTQNHAVLSRLMAEAFEQAGRSRPPHDETEDKSGQK